MMHVKQKKNSKAGMVQYRLNHVHNYKPSQLINNILHLICCSSESSCSKEVTSEGG